MGSLLDAPRLLPHQEEGVRALLTRAGPRQGLLCPLPPRLGKSVLSVEAAYKAGKRNILVVAPVTILDGWIEEIHKWWRGADIPIQKCHGVKPKTTAGWTFTNYETLRGFLTKVGPNSYQLDWPSGYDLLVIDESVKIKSRQAQVTHAVFALRDLNRLATIWLLSGNPAPKDLSDLWTQLYLVDPDRAGRSFWRFAAKYCTIEATQWGDKITGNRTGAERQILRDFAGSIWSPPAQSLPDLTPVETSVVEAPLVGEQLRIYLEMERQFKALLDRLTGSTILAPNTMVQSIRLLQIASNPLIVGGVDDGSKWRMLESYLDRPSFRGPTIVWTAYVETVRLLSERLGRRFTIETLTGSTSQKRRTEVRHAFQAGEIEVLLAHPGVGKFGLNLSAANSVVWLERSWLGDDYYQAGFRARHLEKHSTVQVVELLALANNTATIDHAVHNVLRRRTTATKRLTVGEVKDAWRR